jgi:tetrahydromethanopterin S-methyltransferase subunit G
MPIAVASAKKYTIALSAPILAANFTTDELRQLATMLESPLRDKLEKVLPQMQNAVGQKVSTDIGPQVNKNLQAMTEAVGTKLQVAVTLK